MSDDLIILIEKDETIVSEIAEQGPQGPAGLPGPPGEVEEHTHAAVDVTQDETHRFVTDTEKAAWTAKQDALGYTPADTADPRLSDARPPTPHAASHATGESDAITPEDIGAAAAEHTHAAAYAPSAHVGAGGTAHAVATESAAGFMSAAAMTKLNGIEAGATADMTAAEILATIGAPSDKTKYLRGDGTWASIGAGENLIGAPGEAGFGVGIAPASALLPGMIALAGCENPASENYGNYMYRDGSIMVWVPRFYYKVGDGSNGLAVNIISIKGIDTYATTADANAAGYALHRVFIDGGVEQPGVFVDKYMCSKNAMGTGYVASSIKNGLPLSAHADHNPFTGLTACSGNYYYEAITAAKARSSVNGTVDDDSPFFCCSRFIYSALAMLAMAHGQSSNSTTNCAWYHATDNFPKGCNNNALGDANDGSISYVSDGYSACGKTGSGTPFPKTTHNGQSCGIADLNGLMWEVSTGLTCIATSKTITGATKANPCVITAAGHGYSTGQTIQITSVGGMTQLNDKIYTITVIDTNTLSLDGVDATGYSAYTGGGACTIGTFYVAKQATKMRDFTSGNSTATDHWGATGIAAMMDTITIPMLAGIGGSSMAQRFGNGANQVLSSDVSGAGWILAGLGAPKDANGMSPSGTNLFGTDYLYQYYRNELCVISGGNWSNGVLAGLWYLSLHSHRTNSHYYIGFRCACYPE
ncbi:MAG: ubiquitin-activating E1 FCCH domain-containing protein [Geobacteraceae bacterium]|nr:ubiquitin-activating E1 FCCH domain-containing protein [Geobacteraceae bacterium]